MAEKTVSADQVSKALGALRSIAGEQVEKGLKGSGQTTGLGAPSESGVGAATQIR